MSIESVSPFRIGMALRSIREKKGLTQAVVSRNAGTPRSYLTQVEGGSRSITVENLARILNGMDASWTEFGHVVDSLTDAEVQKYHETRLADQEARLVKQLQSIRSRLGECHELEE